MNKYLSRVTSSARGETFNPLIWPSLFSTFFYGLGFTVLAGVGSVSHSSLFTAMLSIHPWIPFVWGLVAILTIIVGITFLLFNIPPAGKVSGLVGFMLWLFAGFCWTLTGGWFVALAIAFPNVWFWIWQYLSLSRFKRQDKADTKTMEDYDAGRYDDELNPIDAKADRENNRGVERQ